MTNTPKGRPTPRQKAAANGNGRPGQTPPPPAVLPNGQVVEVALEDITGSLSRTIAEQATKIAMLEAQLAAARRHAVTDHAVLDHHHEAPTEVPA